MRVDSFLRVLLFQRVFILVVGSCNEKTEAHYRTTTRSQQGKKAMTSKKNIESTEQRRAEKVSSGEAFYLLPLFFAA